MMETNIRVIDGFYNNPEEVREFALKEDFNVTGNYPGWRTDPIIDDGIREHLEEIMGINIDETKWNLGEYTGTYQWVSEGIPT